MGQKAKIEDLHLSNTGTLETLYIWEFVHEHRIISTYSGLIKTTTTLQHISSDDEIMWVVSILFKHSVCYSKGRIAQLTS